MNKKQQHIYIYDHPESKIQFLEQTLAGKDWRATLVYPDDTPSHRENLALAQKSFEKRGYQVKSSTNEHGHRTLEIHHLGEGSKPSEIIHEMGLAKGLGRLITNPSIPLEATFGALKNGFGSLEKTIKDPAHLNGLIYLTAEAFMMSPEKKDPLRPAKPNKPKNIWRKLGYGLFFAQSATYLFAAKDNDTVSFNEFKSKIDRTLKSGGEVTELHYDESKDRPSESVGHTVLGLLRRFPIEAGALFNNLGMLLYIVGNHADRSFYRGELARGVTGDAFKAAHDYVKEGTGFLKLKNASGFSHDMRGALTSIAAWTLMLLPARKKDDSLATPASDNVFARSWNAVAQNPQVGTGLLTIASSAQRLMGASIRNKTEPTENQIRGEKIYLGGDVMLMFTKNDHYGKKTGDVDTLASTLADYINKLPVILGPDEQVKMVKNMANYLLDKGLAEIRHKPKTATFTAEELKERSDLLILEVGRRVRNSYGEELEQLGDVTARLIHQFPPQQRTEATAAMAAGLAQLPWVRASVEELLPVLNTSVNRHPATANVTQPVTMKSLRKAVADIVGIMPEADMGGSVALIYDALAPLMAPGKNQQPHQPTDMAQQTAVPSNTIHQARHIASVAHTPAPHMANA
jgi:hypothetical protein